MTPEQAMQLATNKEVAEIATVVVEHFQHSNAPLRIGDIRFEKESGMCSEFVRECCEAAAATPDHGPLTTLYFGYTARQTEAKLRKHHRQIPLSDAQPGDIAAFNSQPFWAGHIAIWLDPPHTIAENTSSRKRGPGFTISRLTPELERKYSGTYRIFNSPKPLKIILLPDNIVIPCNPKITDGVTRADLRPLAEALNYQVIPHIPDQNKIYLKGKS